MTKTIYISRHGQSEYNLLNKIGGDSDISILGEEYAKMLFNFIREEELDKNLEVFTSQLKRTKQTVKYFKDYHVKNFSFLNEINGGDFDDLSYDEIKINYPDEFLKRKNNKFNYCYPNGESYYLLKKRVSKIFEYIENSDKNILIVCHNAVVRIIYGIIYNLDEKEIPHIEIPLHTLFKIENYNDSNNLTKIKFI